MTQETKASNPSTNSSNLLSNMPPFYLFSAQVMDGIEDVVSIGDIIHIIRTNEKGQEPPDGYFFGVKNSMWSSTISMSQFCNIILTIPSNFLKPLDEFL